MIQAKARAVPLELYIHRDDGAPSRDRALRLNMFISVQSTARTAELPPLPRDTGTAQCSAPAGMAIAEPTGMDADKLLEALVNLRLWLVVVTAGALGAIGALIHLASQAPPSTLPATRPPLVPDWGYAALVGGVAAIAVLYVSNPTTGIALIGGSLVAGYAGNSVLAGLEARTAAALAVREAARNETAAKLAREDLAALTSQVANLAPGPSTVSGSQDPVAAVQRFARELQAKHTVA